MELGRLRAQSFFQTKCCRSYAAAASVNVIFPSKCPAMSGLHTSVLLNSHPQHPHKLRGPLPVQSHSTSTKIPEVYSTLTLTLPATVGQERAFTLQGLEKASSWTGTLGICPLSVS